MIGLMLDLPYAYCRLEIASKHEASNFCCYAVITKQYKWISEHLTLKNKVSGVDDLAKNDMTTCSQY